MSADPKTSAAQTNAITRELADPDFNQWGDRRDEYSARIAAWHPVQTGDDATYTRAMKMVGNRHSKAALVDLVNWLLKGQPK